MLMICVLLFLSKSAYSMPTVDEKIILPILFEMSTVDNTDDAMFLIQLYSDLLHELGDYFKGRRETVLTTPPPLLLHQLGDYFKGKKSTTSQEETLNMRFSRSRGHASMPNLLFSWGDNEEQVQNFFRTASIDVNLLHELGDYFKGKRRVF